MDPFVPRRRAPLSPGTGISPRAGRDRAGRSRPAPDHRLRTLTPPHPARGPGGPGGAGGTWGGARSTVVAVISESVVLTGRVLMRPAQIQDAAALCRAFERNREHLRPFDPDRPAHFYTLETQQTRLRDLAAQREAGRTVSWLLTEDEQVLGSVTISSIARGPLSSANLGYWVDGAQTGRGLGTAAAREACRYADEVLGLHRLEAGTLVDNLASQRVLGRCGFVRYGLAPQFLHIAGQWRDHVLFQKILNDRPPQ